MDTAIMYPERCRKNLHRLEAAGINMETGYAMMLMTATLMDLRPEDDEVVRMILKDCGLTEAVA